MNDLLNAVKNLSFNELKILTYLFLVSNEEDEISFKEMQDTLEIPYEIIFDVINDLYMIDLISFNIRENDLQLCMMLIRDKVVRIELTDLDFHIFKLFNQKIFMSDEEVFSTVVMDCYIPAGLYEQSYMFKYTDESIVHKSQIKSDKDKEKTDEQKKKKDERARVRRKANAILEYFYTKMFAIYKIKLNPSLRQQEYFQARNFVLNKDIYDLDLIKQGIDWFLTHEYWKKYVTNLYSFNKHFVKFIAQYKDEQSDIKFL